MKKNSELIKNKLLKLYKKNNPSNPTNLNKRLKIAQNDLEKLSFPLKIFEI